MAERRVVRTRRRRRAVKQDRGHGIEDMVMRNQAAVVATDRAEGWLSGSECRYGIADSAATAVAPLRQPPAAPEPGWESVRRPEGAAVCGRVRVYVCGTGWRGIRNTGCVGIRVAGCERGTCG